MPIYTVTYSEFVPVTFRVEADTVGDAKDWAAIYVEENPEEIADLINNGDARPMFLFDEAENSRFDIDIDLTE